MHKTRRIGLSYSKNQLESENLLWPKRLPLFSVSLKTSSPYFPLVGSYPLNNQYFQSDWRGFFGEK